MPTPDIVFSLEYNLLYKPGSRPAFGYNRNGELIDLKKRSDFVRCKSSNGNLFDYLTRADATDKYDAETIKMVEEITEHTDITKGDILNYASNRPGSTGAFDKDGDISKEKASVIKNELQKTNSIVWTGILSFEEVYGKKYCRNKKDAADLLENTFKNLFKQSHLKYDNIAWFAAMHTNTENPHIHICFWEKEPLFTKRGGQELQYSTLGKINPVAVDDFKFSIANYFEEQHLDFYTLRDNIRNSLKTSLKENTEYLQQLTKIQKSLSAGNTYQYAKLPGELQLEIRKFALAVIENSPDLKEKKNDYIKELQKTQQRYLDICKKNEIQPTIAIKEFVNTRTEELYNKLGNDVCKAIKELDKELKKINLKDEQNEQIKLNKQQLTTNDIALLDKIYQKNIGINFKQLYNGNWEAMPDGKDKRYYKTQESATLAFSSILIYFTQNKEQFDRIISASGLWHDGLSKKYAEQINWAKNIDKINTKEKNYKDVLFEISLFQYQEKTKLKPYDNTFDIAQLTVADKQIISKIMRSKGAEKYQKLMTSVWTHIQSDVKKEFKNLNIETLGLISLFARFTQDDKQIDRLFKASPLYRPDIWEGNYKGQFNWIEEFENAGTKYGDVVKNFVLKKQMNWLAEKEKEWQEKKAKWLAAHPTSKSAFNSKKIIRKAAFDFRRFNSLLIKSLFNMTTYFDKSFTYSQSALKEQERKRKKEEAQELK